MITVMGTVEGVRCLCALVYETGPAVDHAELSRALRLITVGRSSGGLGITATST